MLYHTDNVIGLAHNIITCHSPHLTSLYLILLVIIQMFILSLPDFLFTGYTTPAPGSFLQQGGGELSPHSGLQPPGGFSSIGAEGADPASAERKKAAQQAYQEELKRQVTCCQCPKVITELIGKNITVYLPSPSFASPSGA